MITVDKKASVDLFMYLADRVRIASSCEVAIIARTGRNRRNLHPRNLHLRRNRVIASLSASFFDSASPRDKSPRDSRLSSRSACWIRAISRVCLTIESERIARRRDKRRERGSKAAVPPERDESSEQTLRTGSSVGVLSHFAKRDAGCWLLGILLERRATTAG